MTDPFKQTLSLPAVHELWEHTYRNPHSERLYESIFDWIARNGGVPTASRWLDIGCGIGQHAIRLRRRGYNVVVADFSPDRVRAATRHIREQGLADELQVQTEDLVTGLSFPAASFEAVLCWGVLMHIPQVETAMLELVRVTRPGGRLFVYEANLHGADAMLTRAVSLVKNTLGAAPYRKIAMTPYGREYWATTSAGDLFIRHSRISALARFFAAHGCRIQRRIAGEFTERYSIGGLPGRLAHACNRVWFAAGRIPYLAHGNLLVLEKRQ